jgi:hypothetical protein
LQRNRTVTNARLRVAQVKQSHATSHRAHTSCHATRWHRLCEEQKQKTAPAGAAILDAFVLRWQRWCKAGLGGLLDAIIGAYAASALRPTKGNTGHT